MTVDTVSLPVYCVEVGAARVEDQQGSLLSRGQSASVPTVSSRNMGGSKKV